MPGLIILAVFAGTAIGLHIFRKRKPSKERLEREREVYEERLRQFRVPGNHIKIVIAQSRVHQVHNCPALAWTEGEKLKLLTLKLSPVVTEHDLDEFFFLASQPYVDFIRFDATEYPDWAVQPRAVKEMFRPYVDFSASVGGIDYKRQMYWLGVICLYPQSAAELFRLLGKPLSAYDNLVEDRKLMLTDGSLPEAMAEEAAREWGVATSC